MLINFMNMNQDINEIKRLMIEVSTGEKRIQDVNDEYIELWARINDFLEKSGLDNSNMFSDLWEFYEYWKENLDSYSKRRIYINNLYKNIQIKKSITKINTHLYVNKNRIDELENIKNNNFDLLKLIQYCRELNLAFSNEMYLSIGMILRALIDHVPPIFGKTSFKEVANNYGSKSFQDSMKNLENSSRKIADSFLHTHIRKKEVLPNNTQIDFSNDLDVLLGEIHRLLN